MSFYPPKISERFYAPENAGKAEKTNAVGTGASFTCGSFVRFYLEIDPLTREIRAAKFKTNGCGFAVAAADVLAEKIAGRRLTELHGLERRVLENEIEAELESFAASRRHCLSICLDALEGAFEDFRAFQLEEFAGEKALVCTCFGVSEQTIENAIEDAQAATVEEVGDACRAGTGCGACRFLIQELIDIYWMEKA